jgi:glyoxylase-like metal-dependent hydrolase (beta-lactamase superfamily II)
MTTFPNTLLLRGAHTIVIDPGLPLQNDPVLGALEARGLTAADVDFCVLTHAHVDHAGGCASLMAPVTMHSLETQSPHWVMMGGLLELLPLQLVSGDGGELAPGIQWALTPGHCEGHISLCVETDVGRVVLCGDTIGPDRQAFDAMEAPDGGEGPELLESWRRIRAWEPDLVVAGHLPPFSP